MLIFYAKLTFSQHNFLGESQEFIMKQYNKDPEYSIEIDTINKYTTLITCKTFEQYPYYTYEVDLLRNVCMSYAFVSKDREIYDTYVDILEHIGEVVERDSSYQNVTYKVAGNGKNAYYSIKQPFINSTYYSRRSIFYILITEELKSGEK